MILVVSLVAVATLPVGSNAQTANPNPNNDKFYPGIDETSRCDLPPIGADLTGESFEPTSDMCIESEEVLTLDDAHALAHEYAPILFFHPLENYTLESVDATFNDPSEGSIFYNPTSSVLETFADLNQTSLLRTTRQLNMSLVNRAYFFAHDLNDPPGYVQGAGFEPDESTTNNGRLSRAPIYYNAFESANNTWTYNYYFYYTFNGEADMAALTTYEGKQSYSSFVLWPFGIHEGDWEGLTVTVCRSNVTSQPLAVTYRQHAWSATEDCTQGKCHFFEDTVHPVGFSALNSHATYSISTYNMVYREVNVPLIVNVHGIYLVDRTAYLSTDGTYRYFYPNETNVVRVRDPEEIHIGETDPDDYWMGYASNWGNSTGAEIEPLPPQCLNSDQTSYIDCPSQEEDPMFYLIMEILGVYEVEDLGILEGNPNRERALVQAAADVVQNEGWPRFAKLEPGPLGPATKYFFGALYPSVSGLIWNQIPADTNVSQFCHEILNVPDTFRLAVEKETFNIKGNAIAMICVVFTLAVLTVVFLVHPLSRKALPPFFFDEEGTVVELTRQRKRQVFFAAHLFTFFYLLVVAGGIMFGIGYQKLFALLEEYVDGIPWGIISKFILILGILIMVIDSVLWAYLWHSTRSLWKHIQQQYDYLTAMRDEPPKGLELGYGLGIGLGGLFLSNMLAIICVVVGIAVIGFSFAFSEICSETFGSIGGLCLDVGGILDIDGVKCGADFQEFCNEWAHVEQLITFWGAFFLAIGHFYLVAATGSAYYQHTRLLPFVTMIPTREKYFTLAKKEGSISDAEATEEEPNVVVSLRKGDVNKITERLNSDSEFDVNNEVEKDKS